MTATEHDKRGLLKDLLQQCTPEQREQWREWTTGIEGKELDAAIDMVYFTLERNREAVGAGS